MAYPSQYDNKLEKNSDNSYKIRCHTFDWVPEKNLEPFIMEYKR